MDLPCPVKSNDILIGETCTRQNEFKKRWIWQKLFNRGNGSEKAGRFDDVDG